MLEEEQTDAVRTAFARHADNLIERNDVDHQVEVAYECINSDRILITANPFIENISDLVKIPLKNGWVREYGILYKEPISDAVRKYIETAVEVYQA